VESKRGLGRIAGSGADEPGIQEEWGDEIYYTEEAGEFANNIVVGDVVVWQTIHGGRGVQFGGIGFVAAISDDRMMATIIDGALDVPAEGTWSRHEVVNVPMARLGRLNVARYRKLGLFAEEASA